jgi:hypothetical protein
VNTDVNVQMQLLRVAVGDLLRNRSTGQVWIVGTTYGHHIVLFRTWFADRRKADEWEVVSHHTEHVLDANQSWKLAARAVEIADEQMLALLRDSSVRKTAEVDAYGLCDENGQEVTSLEAASDAIREAYDWLSARNLVALRGDAHGEYIVYLGGAS